MGMIKLAGYIPESFTDGLGIRYVIFTQGCRHNCKGCQNPETWDFNGGKYYSIDKLMESIKEDPLLDGITLSGGDPMYRVDEILELMKRVKSETDLNIWLYTGFTYEECLMDSDMRMALDYIDILVDGRFECGLKSLDLTFKGSSNQRIIDVKESLKQGRVIELDMDLEAS